MLTANPDVAAIYGACGPPIIGALQAIKAAGKKPGDIVVVGFDASPDELTAIKAGDAGRRRSPSSRPRWARWASRPRSPPPAGETVQANVDTGTEMVTKDNVGQFS